MKTNLTLFFFVYFTLKLFEFKGGQGMNEIDVLMCDIVIYHLLMRYKL